LADDCNWPALRYAKSGEAHNQASHRSAEIAPRSFLKAVALLQPDKCAIAKFGDSLKKDLREMATLRRTIVTRGISDHTVK
jgi:hypothetical protein